MKVFAEVAAGLDRALEVELDALGNLDLDRAVEELHVLQARLDGLRAKTLRAWDRRGRWQTHGAKSVAAYLASRRRLPIEACRRDPRVARKLGELPALAVALEAGAIELPHVLRILKIDSPRTHDVLVADHVEMCRWAVRDRWSTFCRKLLDWLDEHDPDGPDPGRTAKRRLHCSKTLGDAYAIEGWLDPVSGAILATELQRLESQLLQEDRAEARQRLDREPLLHELARTSEQRRADALVLMAERSATLPEDGRRGQVLFTVLIGADAFARLCELTNGTQVRPAQLLPYVGDGLFQRVVFDGPTRVLGVSPQRTFRGGQRTAVQARDRTCQAPHCDEPIDRCQIDHRIPAAAGGSTSQDNGRLYCTYHNQARNRTGRDPDERRTGGTRAPPDTAA